HTRGEFDRGRHPFPMRTGATRPKTSSTHHKPDSRRRPARLAASIRPSLDLELDRGLFPPITLDFVLDGLSLIERAQPGLLNGRNMDEYVPAAARRLNESISLCRVEPLHGTCSHFSLQRCARTIQGTPRRNKLVQPASPPPDRILISCCRGLLVAAMSNNGWRWTAPRPDSRNLQSSTSAVDLKFLQFSRKLA